MLSVRGPLRVEHTSNCIGVGMATRLFLYPIIVTMRYNIEHMHECITTLHRAFNHNCKAHSGIYSHYSAKQRLILRAVRLIRKYHLPIKYGVDEYGLVLYFSFNWEQISFHNRWFRKGIKRYKGKRSWRVNESFPMRMYW